MLDSGRFVYVNSAGVRLLAADSSESLLGRDVSDFVDLGDAKDVSAPFEAEVWRVDGTAVPVEVSVSALWDGGSAHRVVLRDLTSVAEHDAPPSEQHFETLVELLDDGVMVAGPDARIKFINPAAARILGLPSRALTANFFARVDELPCYDADGNPLPIEEQPVRRAFRTGLAFSRAVIGTDVANGERKWLLCSGRWLTPKKPGESDMLISFSDITEQREAVAKLMYQANHDPLTGLPNRAFVLRRITEALAATDGPRLRAVLFIDLDDLKTTNDTLGHDAGDDLLNSAATRLRQAFDSEDVVARLGGDEFVVLIFGAPSRGELAGLAARLRDRLAEPVVIAATRTPIRASVGVVEVRSRDRRDAEAILRDADRAMYEAKRAGRNRGLLEPRRLGVVGRD